MTRPRFPPDERRRLIIAAARAIIVERGLASTSLRDIARAADVSVGTLMYHFAGVDEILSAVVIGETERFYADVIDAADAAEPGAALHLLVEPLFADTDDVAEHWRIWADYWSAVARRPGLADAYAQRLRGWEDCCTRVIERGVADGVFSCAAPREAALKLAAYSDGIALQRAQGVAGLSSRTARQWMVELAAVLLATGRPPNPLIAASRLDQNYGPAQSELWPGSTETWARLKRGGS